MTINAQSLELARHVMADRQREASAARQARLLRQPHGDPTPRIEDASSSFALRLLPLRSPRTVARRIHRLAVAAVFVPLVLSGGLTMLLALTNGSLRD
jgi:hypothetical protein